jgi:hypothetical protein
MSDKNREMEKTKCATPAEAKDPVGATVNSGVENVEQKFREPQSDYTDAGVERKEDGDIVVSSSIDAVKDPIGSGKDSKRLKLLDTIAEAQRKYLETEDVSINAFAF